MAKRKESPILAVAVRENVQRYSGTVDEEHNDVLCKSNHHMIGPLYEYLHQVVTRNFGPKFQLSKFGPTGFQKSRLSFPGNGQYTL